MSTHFLVIGATGPCGIAFAKAALKAGHKLTLYARTPSKIPAEIKDHANVTTVEGQLNDEATLQKAVNGGATVFTSFAGPVFGTKGTPITDGLKVIFPLLVAARYERVLLLGTPSYTAPEDKGALKYKAVIGLVRLVGGDASREYSEMGRFVATQSVDDLKWTLFRVTLINNGETKPVTATYTGWGQDGLFISRSSIAEWVLQELKEGKWIGKMPAISN